ncbi:unnamed protein product [Agarophyton chilense]
MKRSLAATVLIAVLLTPTLGILIRQAQLGLLVRMEVEGRDGKSDKGRAGEVGGDGCALGAVKAGGITCNRENNGDDGLRASGEDGDAGGDGCEPGSSAGKGDDGGDGDVIAYGDDRVRGVALVVAVGEEAEGGTGCDFCGNGDNRGEGGEEIAGDGTFVGPMAIMEKTAGLEEMA